MKRKLIEIINQLQEENNIQPTKELNDSDDLVKDLGFDSMILAELTVIIEEEYGIDNFEKKIIRKVSEIKEQINE